MRIVTRGDQQFREHELLSPDAAFSDESDGRDRSSDPDFLRNDFQRDRDKIPVNPNEISKPVLAEAKEALIISVKTAVSPPMTNLPIATTKAIKKKAIQI